MCRAGRPGQDRSTEQQCAGHGSWACLNSLQVFLHYSLPPSTGNPIPVCVVVGCGFPDLKHEGKTSSDAWKEQQHAEVFRPNRIFSEPEQLLSKCHAGWLLLGIAFSFGVCFWYYHTLCYCKPGSLYHMMAHVDHVSNGRHGQSSDCF